MPVSDDNIVKTDVISVGPDDNVGEMISLFSQKHIRMMPVIDEAGRLLGVFSLKAVLDNLLPVSATMDDGLQRLDFVVGASPGIAKRLKKLKMQKVSEIMLTDCVVVRPDTATWEAVRLIARYGSPIPVVEEESGVLKGIISSQSLLAGLRQILEEVEKADK